MNLCAVHAVRWFETKRVKKEEIIEKNESRFVSDS